MELGLALAVYLAVVNAVMLLLFRIDKRRALTGQWRISEATLLVWAAAGGWFGAKLAQRLFRHKTRKQPFGRRLNLCLAGPLGVAVVLAMAPSALPGWPGAGALAARLTWSVGETDEGVVAGGAPSGAWSPGRVAARPVGRAAGDLPRRFGPGSEAGRQHLGRQDGGQGGEWSAKPLTRPGRIVSGLSRPRRLVD
jgi:uncharacterized membrane protein YsdA (DUF1294 family)